MKRAERYFILDGIKSSDYGIDFDGSDGFGVAERDVDVVSVAGRNGDLTIDNGRFNNVSFEYGIKLYAADYDGVRRDFRHSPTWFIAAYESVSDFLGTKQDKYYRLEDTYHPGQYVMAKVTGGIEPTIKENARGAVYAEFNVKFTRKPQRFLTDGETAISITAAGTEITNPTVYAANPLIRIHATGAGTVEVGSQIITLTASPSSYVDVDSSLRDCYEDGNSRTGIVQMEDYPTLPAGSTTIKFSGDISAVEVTPNWWRI